MPAARQFVCALSDILEFAGVCALVGGEQVAIYRVGDEVFALENFDPWSRANVMSRGIVGDLAGQLVAASPVYKQHFNLRTGRCLEDESVALRVWNCGVLDGRVWIEPLPAAVDASGARAGADSSCWNGMAAMRREELLKNSPQAHASDLRSRAAG